VRPLPSAPGGLRRHRLESAVVLLAIALAAYAGVVYFFSFSPDTSVSRYGVHAAILMMDLLIGGLVLRDWKTRSRSNRPEPRGWLRLMAYGSLVYVTLLHVDYAIAWYDGAEEARTGSLPTLKINLLAGQLVSLLLVTLSNALATRPSAIQKRFAPERRDVLLLSVVFIPLVNYLAHNESLFSFGTAAGYLGFFVALPLAALIFLQVFQRALNAEALAAPYVAGLALVFYSMPVVSSMLMRPVESLFWVHAGLALLVPTILAVLYRANRVLTAKVLVIGAACSAVGSFVQAQLARPDRQNQTAAASLAQPDPRQAALSALLSSPVARRPDVYLLIYDGYAAGSMMKHYGLEDHSLDYLRRSGFTIHDDIYSIFWSSRGSMTSLMDMSAVPRAGIGGNNTSITFFRDHGYTTNLIINAYLLEGNRTIAADYLFPRWTPQSSLSALYRGIAGGEFRSDIVFQDFDRDEWLAAKRAVLKAPAGEPRMLYAHSGFPGHSQNSGTCLPDETAQYAARLAVASEEIRDDLEAIDSSHRDAIVIVAGDHGPYLTGDCLYMAQHAASELTAAHLADRYGTRLAIRWPAAVSGRSDPIEVIQDAFFAVAAYLLDDDRVWLHRVRTETFGYGGLPDGSVKDGIVMVGKDKGRRLFER
jgi:hypothetical protein